VAGLFARGFESNPGSVKYASVGIGTLGHLAMTMFAKQAGVEITHC
jgi:tripartite-type tricarboxylate transporter receptor subunit TctC